jgi:hypothetical protein
MTYFTGPQLANSRASADVRIKRALDIKQGKIGIDAATLSYPQLASLVGVSRYQLQKAGRRNGNGNGAHKPDPVEQQLKSFHALTPDQQVGFFHGLGTDLSLELAAAADKQREEVPLVA